MSNSVADIIAPRSLDREILDAFRPFIQREDFKYTKTEAEVLGESTSYGKVENDWPKDLLEVASRDGEIIRQLKIFFFEDLISVRVTRRPQNNTTTDPPLFDDVVVAYEQQQRRKPFPELQTLVAEVQKAVLGISRGKLLSLGTVEVQEVIRQQQASLLDMQKTTAQFARDIADATKRNEEVLQANKLELFKQAEEERRRLAEEHQTHLKEVFDKKAELEKLRGELDEADARDKRRKIYADIISVLTTKKVTTIGPDGKLQVREEPGWDQNFDLTPATSRKRGYVHAFSILAILVLTGAAGYFFHETMKPPEATAAVVFVLVRQLLLTGLLATMVILYFRFLASWFEQRASEEFRNKRLLLDVHRANWFAELAFQWRKDHDETMPHQIVERMTHHLFDDPADEHATEKLKSLLKAKYLRLKAGDDFEMEISKQSRPPGGEKSEK